MSVRSKRRRRAWRKAEFYSSPNIVRSATFAHLHSRVWAAPNKYDRDGRYPTYNDWAPR